MRRWLTYREAAAEVGRSKRAIQMWRRRGMPMSWDTQGRRIVDETTLYSWYRKNLSTWPAHQQKLRRIMRDTPTEPKVLPDS